MTTDEILAEIRSRMDELQMSQAALSRAANVHPVYVNRVLRGHAKPSSQVLLKLLRAVGLRLYVTR